MKSLRSLLSLLGLATLAAIASSGCSTYRYHQEPHRVIVRDGVTTETNASDLFLGKTSPPLVGVAEFAALSANVYENEAFKRATQLREFCEDDDKFLEPVNWHEESGLPQPEPAPRGRHFAKGLKYQVWVREAPGSPPLAVIAFRGTVGQDGKSGSWWSNLRWFTRSLPIWDEYDQTTEVLPRLVEFIRQKHGADTQIVATGHSLGGGLAQLTGYISQQVKTVYAFDPSPVTGYFSVKPTKSRDANKIGVSTFRIYQRGEILEYARWLVKRVWPLTHKDPRIVEVRFNLLPPGNAVSMHSMKRFACKLYETCVAAGAEHCGEAPAVIEQMASGGGEHR